VASGQSSDHRGMDRSYNRGAIMGLTVAEAFILLAFCLLLLFTWWQVETEKKSLMAADQIGTLSDIEKQQIIAGLSDGTLEMALALREAGLGSTQPLELSEWSRFMNNEDLQRLMQASVRLSPDTQLELANVVEVTNEAALNAALLALQGPEQASGTVEVIADRLQDAAQQADSLVAMIDERLGERIRQEGGSIDASGTITLPQEILFGKNEYTVRNPELLKLICGDWLSVLQDSGLPLADLKIEGHASSEAQVGSAEGDWLYNLDLSQRRAQNVLALCLEALENPSLLAWAHQHLSAVGYSSSRLIRRPDGSEDQEASRRVMFSVALNQDVLLRDIRQEVAAGTPVMAATGPARVIDGDTLEINGTSFRLAGIDAPELGQLCVANDRTAFDCGDVARRMMEQAVAGQDISCSADTVDRYGRPIAICRSGMVDLGKQMVVQGVAVAATQFSDAYVSDQSNAKAENIGLWTTEFQMPWDYRSGQ
jgi:endonuclease YncB( thermonuclease family)